MADKKVSELSAITNLSGDDLLLVVNDPLGSPESKKVSITNMFANVVPTTVHKGEVSFRANTSFIGTKATFSANVIVDGINVLDRLKDTYQIANVEAKFTSNTYIQGLAANYVANSTFQNVTGNLVSKIAQTEQVLSAPMRVDAPSEGINDGVYISNGAIQVFSATGSPSHIDLYCESNNAHRVRIISDVHANFSGDAEVTLPVSNGTLALAENQIDKLSTTTQSTVANLHIASSNTTTGVQLSNTNITVRGIESTKGSITLYDDTNVGFTTIQTPDNADVSSANTGVVLLTPIKSGNLALEIFSAGDPSSNNTTSEGYDVGDIFYSNSYLYICTSANTIKRVALSLF